MKKTRTGNVAALRESEAGLEKRCLACREHWPMDGEFFAIVPARRDGLSTRCRACIKEKFWGYADLRGAARGGD